jgi:hypothetical protein
MSPANSERQTLRDSCIVMAARFVAAQPGGVRRVLEAHQRRPDGSCTCRTHVVTPWPCVLVAIAVAAQQLGPAA